MGGDAGSNEAGSDGGDALFERDAGGCACRAGSPLERIPAGLLPWVLLAVVGVRRRFRSRDV